MQPTPNVLGAPANGLLGRWGGSKYNQLNPTALSGMTAWYDANERNTLFVDASGRTSVVSNRAEDGGDRFLYLNGASGTYASAPDSAALSVANLDIQALVALDDWTPATLATIVSKRLATGNQCSYALSVSATTGTLRLDHSLDGTTANEVTTVSSEIPSVSDFSRLWIRATRSGSTGAIRFYTGGSGDSPVWVQLGIDRTSTAGNLFDSTAALNIGGWNNGTTQVPYCRVFRAIVRNGYDGAGSTVFDANFSTHTTGSAPLTESANGAVVSFLGNARVTYVGPTNCLALNGVAGNYASGPGSAGQVSGDIGIYARVRPVSWASGAEQRILCRRDGNTQIEYDLLINSTGNLLLVTSPDGTATVTAASTVNVVGILSNLTTYWIYATRDVNDGAGNNLTKFYWAADTGSNTPPAIASMTQLGTTVSNVGTTSIATGLSNLSVGARNIGAASVFNGVVFYADVRNAYDTAGTIQAFFDPSGTPKLASPVVNGSTTWTINSTGDLGARIAGEKDLVQLTTTKQPIYLPWSGTNYGWLNGVSGTYFSAPDSASMPTGDVDVRALVALTSWTPAADNTLIAKYGAAGNRTFSLFIAATTGRVWLAWSADGTTILTASSTASPNVSNFASIWIRATLDVDNGAGGNTVTFFTSADGVTWSQLGTAVTAVGTTSLFNSTAVIEVGSTGTGTGSRLSGNVFRAQVLNGINGTVVADFNPSRYTSGTENPSEPLQTGVTSDGSTANRRCESVPGSAGAVAGLQISVPFEFDVPTSNPAASAYVFNFASNTGPYQNANELGLFLSTDGALILRAIGATTGDQRVLTYSGFRAAYSGQKVKGVVVFDAPNSTTNPKIYIGSSDAISSFTSSTAGTPPNWVSTSLTTSYFVCGYAWPAGNFAPWAPIIGALSSTEVSTWNSTGRLPSWCERSTGSAVSFYTSNYSTASADGWATTDTLWTGTPNVDANADGAGVPPSNDWFKGVSSTTQANRHFYGSFSNNQPSRAYQSVWRITGSVFLPTGSTITHFRIVSVNDSPQPTLATVALTAGTTTNFDIFVRPSAANFRPYFETSNSSGTVVSVASGVAWYWKDIKFYDCGPIAKWANTGTDYGANGISLSLTSGMTAVSGYSSYDWRVWYLNGGSTIVNRTSLYFDGSDDYMKAPAFALSQPETVYFVGQQVSWTGSDAILDGNAAGSMTLTQNTSSPNVAIFAGSTVALNGNWPVGAIAIATSIFNGASSSLRINRTTATTGNPGAANGGGFALGAIGSAATQLGNIRANEVAIYAAAQDTSTQNRWALYAGKKWGFNA